MSYYRKYRPQKFIDLIGQDHIRQTLSNALQSGSFSHAYIFVRKFRGMTIVNSRESL